MSFAQYADFQDCVRRNSDKKNPRAYCAVIERASKPKKTNFSKKAMESASRSFK